MPSWCSVFGAGTRIERFSQLMSSQRSSFGSLGTRTPAKRARATSARHWASGSSSMTASAVAASM
ncbi:MAG: hypothetical protein AAF333_04075 [Planctomycetota bacterium]